MFSKRAVFSSVFAVVKKMKIQTLYLNDNRNTEIFNTAATDENTAQLELNFLKHFLNHVLYAEMEKSFEH